MDISGATRTLAPLKIVNSTLTIPTADRVEIHNLTDQVASLPGLNEVSQGAVLPHSLPR